MHSDRSEAAAFFARAAAAGKLSGSYIIAGPAESGPDAVAIDVASALLCNAPPAKGAACGKCRDCRLVRGLSHPDCQVIHVLPAGRNEKSGDGPLERLSADQIDRIREELRLKAADPAYQLQIPGANVIKLSSIRELRRRAALKRSEAAARAVLIFDAHLMTPEAANALLKTLEEPAPDLTIILTTSSPDLLLPTVRSRCQIVRLGAPPPGLADDPAGELVLELLRTLLGKSEQETVGLVERLDDELDRNEIARVLAGVQEWFRRAMALSELSRSGSAGGEGPLEKFIARYPAIDYNAVYEAVEGAISDLSKNVYIPLVFINLRINLRRLHQISAGKSAV